MKKESEEPSKQAQVGRKQERVEVSSTARNLGISTNFKAKISITENPKNSHSKICSMKFLANTFTTLCEQLESKKPGSSKTVCLEMIKVIEKATLAFYDL